MISVIIPTVRSNNIIPCIYSIYDCVKDIDYEIVIVADYEPVLFNKNMKWINQTERRGVVDATNTGFKCSEGEYIMTISDECRFMNNCFYHLLKTMKKHNDKVITSPRIEPSSPFNYYGVEFAPFPFVHRSLITDNYIFDPVYKSFYADPDLTLRLHQKKIEFRLTRDALVYHPFVNDDVHKLNVENHCHIDREVFKSRWANLGEFKDP